MKTHILLITLLLQALHSIGQTFTINGTIANYAHQSLYIYQCYGDTLLLVDSVKTNAQGHFSFSRQHLSQGLYRFNLPNNQWFYILNDGNPIKIKTVYQFSGFYNIATDSLVVLQSEDNKRFYKFQHLQQKLNIANYWLLQMMRLYPLYDPFHKQIEDEYFRRYKAMEEFVKSLPVNDNKKTQRQASMAEKVILAYYLPVNPDWRQPDPWRDSIIALHYFDYFNPADSFYLHTNILPEKLDIYLSLPLDNTPTSLETSGQKEEKVKRAADAWMQKVSSNQQVVEWSLNYLFKVLEKQKMYDALYFLYNKYVQSTLSDCDPPAAYKSLHEKMSVLKNIQIGSAAPDFEIEKGKLSLYALQSDYTLLLFWATWCPHCMEEVPKIRDVVNQINAQLNSKGKNLMVLAVSLDTNKTQWQRYVTENNLLSFINFSEYKGWQSEVVKKYNVYATPTMFLLDKDKKIIAKPETAEQLVNIFNTE